MDYFLKDYNQNSGSSMALVLFLNAMEHVSRSRIISQPYGNALLMGVGGRVVNLSLDFIVTPATLSSARSPWASPMAGTSGARTSNAPRPPERKMGRACHGLLI